MVHKRTAYNAFIKMNHRSVRSSISNPTSKRVISELYKRWREMPQQERCKYIAIAKTAKTGVFKPKKKGRRYRHYY